MGKGPYLTESSSITGAERPPDACMNLRNLREVDTALCGMFFLMRRAVTLRDDGAYEYLGRSSYALLTRGRRVPSASSSRF